jgi:hypothetical protein
MLIVVDVHAPCRCPLTALKCKNLSLTNIYYQARIQNFAVGGMISILYVTANLQSPGG